MSRPELRLVADYGASPLWTVQRNVLVDDLPLSPRLKAELDRWAKGVRRNYAQGHADEARRLRAN